MVGIWGVNNHLLGLVTRCLKAMLDNAKIMLRQTGEDAARTIKRLLERAQQDGTIGSLSI